jgi:hypothetical protein
LISAGSGTPAKRFRFKCVRERKLRKKKSARANGRDEFSSNEFSSDECGKVRAIEIVSREKRMDVGFAEGKTRELSTEDSVVDSDVKGLSKDRESVGPT